jgi:hypothetical protein
MENRTLTFWVSNGALPFIQAEFEEGYVSVLRTEDDGTVMISMVVDAVAACKLVIAGSESVRSIYHPAKK